VEGISGFLVAFLGGAGSPCLSLTLILTQKEIRHVNMGRAEGEGLLLSANFSLSCLERTIVKIYQSQARIAHKQESLQ